MPGPYQPSTSGQSSTAATGRRTHRCRDRRSGTLPQALLFLALCVVTVLAEAGAGFTTEAGAGLTTEAGAGLAAAGAGAGPRVISTDPGITALVKALGAAPLLVAVDASSRPERKGLPRVGYHRALAAEGLLALRPDLLLVSDHAGPEPVLASVAAAGVRVERLTAPLTGSELLDNVAHLGEALGRREPAMALRDELDARLQALAHARLPARQALFVRERGGALRVAGSGTAGDAFLGLLGAENAVDFPGYRSFSAESLLAVDAPLLVLALDEGDRAADFLARHPALRFSAAVRAEGLLRVDAAALVGGIGIDALAAAERILAAAPALAGS